MKRRNDLFYNTIGILITNKCTTECPVCCCSCRKNSSDEIPLKIIFDCINQACNERHIKHIAISGGDPFLRYGDLLSIIAYSKQNGFETSCYTNASWCNSPERTQEVVSNLEISGLDTLRISLDVQHSLHVPLNNYKNLIQSLRKSKIRTFINTGVLGNDLLENMNLIKKVGVGGNGVLRYDTQIFPFLRIGDAKKIDDDLFLKNVCISNLECPRNPILLIDSCGDAYGCEMCFNKSYRIGNVYRDNLHTILKSSQKELYYKAIKKFGLKRIAVAMENSGINIPFPFVSSCEFCNWVFSNFDKTEIYGILGESSFG